MTILIILGYIFLCCSVKGLIDSVVNLVNKKLVNDNIKDFTIYLIISILIAAHLIKYHLL